MYLQPVLGSAACNTQVGNITMILPVQFKVCGGETVAMTTANNNSLQLNVSLEIGADTINVEYSNYSTWFISNASFCPVTAYELVDVNDTALVSKFILINPIDKILEIKSSVNESQNTTVYLKAKTAEGRFVRRPIYVNWTDPPPPPPVVVVVVVKEPEPEPVPKPVVVVEENAF